MFNIRTWAVLFILFTSVILLLTPSRLVSAQYNTGCPAIYGSQCPTGNLFINKQVQNPKTGELVDSLTANDPTFLPEQIIHFRIEVKNTGSVNLQNIQVQDKFPDFLDFVSGPAEFNQTNHQLFWSIDKLSPSESKFFDIQGKVKPKKILPNTSIICVTNFSQAQQDQQIVQDSVPFCIQTQILSTVSELPKTGIDYTSILIAFTALSLVTSIVLIRKTY